MMISTRDDVVALRDRISFFSEDAIAAMKQAIADAFRKRPSVTAASEADYLDVTLRLADDSASHLGMLAHDVNKGVRSLSASELAKLDAIQQMTEDLMQGAK